MTVEAGPTIVENDLILYLDPQNTRSYTTGTTFTDLSGTTNTGTLQNSPTFNTTNFLFNGTNQEITTTNQFINPQAYTTCVWFKTTSTAGRVLLQFENAQTGTGTSSYDRKMWVGTDGFLYTGIYTGITAYARTGFTVTDNVWRYASAHYNGTDLSLYVNGILQITYGSIGAAQTYNGWWRVAGYQSTGWTNSSTGYFSGNVGPVQIYNRSLTATEILQNFNAQRGRFGV
jgi:hypothetical protein